MARPFIARRKTRRTMIAADVFSTNPRLTFVRPEEDLHGSTVAGSVTPPGARR
jgi:hypothetical protein